MKKLAFYLLTFICSSSFIYAQDYEEVAIDSILSVRLPLSSFQHTQNDSLAGLVRFETYGNDGDTYYAVYRVQANQPVCISNRKEMKAIYKELNDNLINGLNGQRIIYNSSFNDNDVYQGVLEYNSLHEEEDVLYNSDYHFIQIKETMYQISLYQPAKSARKRTADRFFNSIKINDAYTKENQFTDCNRFDALFNDNKKGNLSTAYQTGYALGYVFAGFLCFAIVIGIIILVIVLVVRRNKKSSQQKWDEFNN